MASSIVRRSEAGSSIVRRNGNGSGNGHARDLGVSQTRLTEMTKAAAGSMRSDVAAAETAAEAARAESQRDDRSQFEQRIVEAHAWRDDRKYIVGWSEGRDVHLLYRDDMGRRRLEVVKQGRDFRWYFYMRTDDALRVPVHAWEHWKARGVFEGIELDPRSDDWTRVYARRVVTQTKWLRERGEIGVSINIMDDSRMRKTGTKGTESGNGDYKGTEFWRTVAERRRKSMAEARKGNYSKFEDEQKLHDFIVGERPGDPRGLHTYGPTYEADLTPRQRFMTDHFLQIEDTYNDLYLDIETDDSRPGWKEKETWRHLSYALIFKDRRGRETRTSFVAESESDEGEKRMLLDVRDVLDEADVVYAWNGYNFDFPILRARFNLHGIKFDWRQVAFCDLLAVWRRYHFRSASAVTSYALGELGPKVLHREKMDWREASERAGRRVVRIIDLYRHHPGILRRYNEVDVDLLYGLEKAMGYAGVDHVFCRIGNCFMNDYHISTKVDMLLLNKGAANGSHFYTRGLQQDVLPAYIKEKVSQQRRSIGTEGEVDVDKGKGQRAEYVGAYVFPPVVGYHEGVAALDFKSLYPTVMTLFNISPETWVPRDEAAAMDPALLTTTPSGAFFRKDVVGMVPLVFRETMEKRKVYSRLQLSEEIGSEKFLLYYRLSYAYKRLGLSFYGELGNETSRFFNPEVAEAVTLGGQWFIKRTSEYAARLGYPTLAGDTDSLYLRMTEAQAEAFVREVDGWYRELVKPFNVDPSRFMMELEYENYFRNILFVKKKRYAGRMVVFKGKPADNYLEVKGLEMMRSDGLEYARRFQREALELALGDGSRRGLAPAGELVDLVERKREEVLSGSLLGEAVASSQSIDKPPEEYKSKPPHVRVAQHIRATTTEFYVGMKVPYVMVPGAADPERPRRRVAAEPVWLREYREGTYDAAHVWNKKVWPVTQRVLEAAYPREDWDRFVVDTRPPPAERRERRPRKRRPAREP